MAERFKIRKQIIVILVLFSVICYLLSDSVQAYVMSSQNYRVQSDSINIGGLDEQSSANYKMKDTIGEIATGESDSDSYKLKAGYRQMQEIYISISSPADVTMSAAIPGITGNPGAPRTGSATWTVKTDNPAGFTLSLAATTSPAMQLDDTWNFSDYTSPTSTEPEYTWASPASSQAEFGYTVEPETAADTATLFKDDGAAACNTGALNGTNTCWDAASTTAVTIVNRSTDTDPTGEDELVKFQTESSAKFLKEGNYTATITATAITN